MWIKVDPFKISPLFLTGVFTKRRCNKKKMWWQEWTIDDGVMVDGNKPITSGVLGVVIMSGFGVLGEKRETLRVF